MTPKNYEITFNVKLAEVLRTKNPAWRASGSAVIAEGVDTLTEGGRPDVLIQNAFGCPIVLETEYAPAITVEDDALARLGKTIKHTGQEVEFAIALRAPEELKNVGQTQLRRKIQRARFEYCLFSSVTKGEDPERWPASGWLVGDIDELATLIENAFISEKAIRSGLEIFENGIKGAAGFLHTTTQNTPAVHEHIAAALHQEKGEQTTHMAMAILVNALIFHERIAGAHGIKNLTQLMEDTQDFPKTVALDQWQYILDEINYWPIFHIARQIVLPMPSASATTLLGNLARVADRLIAIGTTQSHDLSGRLFQRLITDRKFLATFYTLPESAMLLAELAVTRLQLDWKSPEAITSLRIADMACGTGTLLAAAYHVLLTRYRRNGKDDAALHKAMIENALIATDIMPAAAHLAVSMLSSMHPNILFEKTKVHVLPYGKATQTKAAAPVDLGALDMIHDEYATDLFLSTDIKTIHGKVGEIGPEGGAAENFQLPHASCDLVIMNPPFTRPTGHEAQKVGVPVPSFAGFGTTDDDQSAMSQKLQSICRGLAEYAGTGQAGLASNFLDLAHRKLKPHGTLALVLPVGAIQGPVWARGRALLNKWYDDLLVVSIATSGSKERAFSADTGMAEILLLATKRPTERKCGSAEVRFASLLRRPKTAAEAGVLERSITEAQGDITIGEQQLGTTITATLNDGGLAGLFDFEIAETCWKLSESKLSLPGMNKSRRLPTTALDEVATRGLYHMDINGWQPDGSPRGPFDIKNLAGSPTYPCLWGHAAESERRLLVQPDKQGKIRPGMKKKAREAWTSATRLHFTRDFRLNSQSLAACVTPKTGLGGRAWPNVKPRKASHEAAILLWANTTLGLILFWWHGTRQQNGRVCVPISLLPTLTVLDTRKLSTAQHTKAKKMLGHFKTKEFLPANEAYRDATRKELDRAVLVDLLGLPKSILEPLDLLRDKWCHEPSVHGGKSTRPGHKDDA